MPEATGSLSECVRLARRETPVLNSRGKPVAAVVPPDDEDHFSMRLANNPEFIAIIERGRAQYRSHGGISIEEIRRKCDLQSKPRGRTVRKAG